MTNRNTVTGICKRCGGAIRFLGTPGTHRNAATSYETCLYQCQECRTRYSNARNPEQRTAFVPRPDENIPPEVRAGLTEVLNGAINDTNRRNKQEKFCADTSEDALTWTVFRWLHQAGHAALLPVFCGSRQPTSEPALLLWGAPAGGAEAERVRVLYEQVSRVLGEDDRRRTEIDVLLVWADLAVAVEVKYRSPNDRRSGRVDRVRRYVQAHLFTADYRAVDALGFYELARNWAFGSALADALGRPFLLVNLGPEHLRADMAKFRTQLRETVTRRSAFLSWAELAGGLRSTGLVPDWMTSYMKERGLSPEVHGEG